MALTLLALIDAINPCTLAVQALLLANLLIKRGKRDVLIGGLLFSFTIFLLYFLYGLGILHITNVLRSNTLYYILNALLLLMIIAELNGYFRGTEGIVSMEMPMVLRKYARKATNLATSPLSTIPIAMALAMLLLPCSSGPYITALGMLGNVINKIFILVYYNILFISPMILITLLVAKGLSPEVVLKWREKHIKHLHLASAILLIIVFLYFNYNYFAYTSSKHISGSVYLVYSLTCPHCNHLKESLPSDINVTFVSINSNKVKEISNRLREWSGGVPLMICFRNQSPLVMLGYPSASQDNNGYFYGEKEEQKMCEEYNGTKVFKDGKYVYCLLPSGFMMGNKYALQEIIEAYKRNECI